MMKTVNLQQEIRICPDQKSDCPHRGRERGGSFFDGCYMVNNLGKLSASPQVRYMDNLVVDKTTYNGLYYFDQYGKMVTDPGIHYLEMNAAGQMFDGYYYFGGENGVPGAGRRYHTGRAFLLMEQER